MNFAVDVVEAAPAGALALVEIARDGSRREWTFGEVADHAPGGQIGGDQQVADKVDEIGKPGDIVPRCPSRGTTCRGFQ